MSMNQQVIDLLQSKGYSIHQTDQRILLRRKVMTHWRSILALLIPGVAMVILGVLLKDSVGLSIFYLAPGLS
jgi:hypothetical protein